MIPYVLTISGSDSSGCSGLQADNRAIHAAGAMPVNVVTANTLQTPSGFQELNLISSDVVVRQMRALLQSYPIGAIKIGLIGTAQRVEAVARVLSEFPDPFVILDPIISTSSGRELLDESGLVVLNRKLMRHVDLLMPNLEESPYVEPGPETSVLLKGGHADGDDCTDVLIEADGTRLFFSSPRVNTKNARGTGCSLSSAIAARIALGESLPTAVRLAKDWLQKGLQENVIKNFAEQGPAFS